MNKIARNIMLLFFIIAGINLHANSTFPNEEGNSKEEDESIKNISHHPILNVKTNLLYDVAFIIPQYGWASTPNISVEYLPNKGHITPVVELDWASWRNDNHNKTWIIHNVVLEGRYYFQNAPSFMGHYVSVYGNIGNYDIQFSKTKGWLSNKWNKNYGAGIGWGYVKRFSSSSRWKWEVNAAVGYLHSRYDGYHAAETWADPGKYYFNWHNNANEYRRYSKHINYFGVTRLGVSISYDLFSF